MTQGPRERPAAFGGVQAGRIGMQPGTSTGQPATGIGDGGCGSADLGHDHSDQDGPVAAPSASHARSYRPLEEPDVVNGSGLHVTRPGQSSAPTGTAIPAARRPLRLARVGPGHRAVDDGAEGSTSGRMSIRHPVSLAASRAFCPSLPIASESW